MEMFARVRTFAPGSALLRQGQAGDHVYLISRGKVRLDHEPSPSRSRAQPLTLADVGPGEVVGEAGLFDGRASPVTPVALEEGTVVQINYAANALTTIQYPEAVEPLRQARQRRGSGAMASTDGSVTPQLAPPVGGVHHLPKGG